MWFLELDNFKSGKIKYFTLQLINVKKINCGIERRH